MFFQVEREQEEPYAGSFRYARNKYLEYVEETKAEYPDLRVSPRFYLHQHWEADALVRFNRWLDKQKLSSKSRYGIYKSVRRVMDIAYSIRVIDTVVYHAPMHKGARETNSRSSYTEDQQEIINAALAKWVNVARGLLQGYERSDKGIPYRKKNTLAQIEIEGVQYKPADAARHFGVSRGDIQARLKIGWDVREAIGLERRKRASSSAPKELVVEGVSYPSLAQAASAYGTDVALVSQRLRKGCTPEQSVGLVPIHVLRSDERALLWSFENEYQCDAYAMLTDFRRRNLCGIASDKRLRMLFCRWGVWPFVDDRVVMPLAAELCMITGLNVEALKKLEIDSFQSEHGLTGSAVITYLKKRSASQTRPEQQTLHIDLLEVEEHFLDQKIAVRVERLIEVILAITSKIRPFAPKEMQQRLFIFEDVEASRSLGRRVIVGIDPLGKAKTWYNRFATEEGLRENFGADFRFNLARCRPTLVTNLVLSGADPFQVQVAIGHGSVSTTTTYMDEHRLRPVFNAVVNDALGKIARRSIEHRTTKASKSKSKKRSATVSTDTFHETLSGCGCLDPYSPSDVVRKVTRHKDGAICKHWNMCLFCDSAIITESSLPKIIIYRERVSAALEKGSPSLEPRRKLLEDVVKLIDGALQDDAIFSKEVLREAKLKSVSLDDILVDQLIYQGI